MRAELRPSQVAPGAVLELDGRPRRVIGSLRFDKDGIRWGEHCIEATPGPHSGSRSVRAAASRSSTGPPATTSSASPTAPA